LDSHPDTFTAAILRGETPAQAITEKVFNKLPISQLCSWAKTHLEAEDLVVLEASGNTFEVVRRLASVGRKAIPLESYHLGKLKEAHANNDKISAIRIGKAYLAGTAKEVWVPDSLTQERRDWFHAYQKATRRTTQMKNRLLSYLSDQGVRLEEGLPSLQNRLGVLRNAKAWTPRQWQVVEGFLLELSHAEQQREHWRSLMAQEVLGDPLLLSMVRLCGVRDVIAFALGAIIGDVKRFANPRKLVGYVGLNPAFDESGNEAWRGGVGGRGRKDLRSLLVQAAQAIIRSHHPLAKWGKKLLASKGCYNLAVAAVARRLTVAIWYLMMGRWTPLEEVDTHLNLKIGRIVGKVGKTGLETLGKSRKTLRDETVEALKKGRVYAVDGTAYVMERVQKTAPKEG